MYNKGPLYEVLDASEWFSFEEGLRGVARFCSASVLHLYCICTASVYCSTVVL